MYDDILLPTDGSEGTRRAVDHAITLADRFGATLHALAVVDREEAKAPSNVDELRAACESAVESVAADGAVADVPTRMEVREGIAHEEIVSYATDADIDMIVMGTHGRTGLDRMLLGSVTERVVRSAPVPVVTVGMTAGVTGVGNSEAAAERAVAVLEDEGHEAVELSDDPFQTAGTWVVPATTDDGVYNVHIDPSNGTTRIAQLS